MMLKILNYISTISCAITIILLYAFIVISDSFYLNGYTILIFLLMLLNPITNLCRLNKKIIKSPVFYFMILSLIGYIMYTLINTIIIYIENFDSASNNYLALNMSKLYFSDKLIYIFITTIIILLATFIFKKINVKSDKDNSKIMLLIIFITSIMPLLSKNIWTMNLICSAFNITLLIFSIIIYFKLKSINTASELRSYYLILIICSLISINPIALILSIYIFLQLDTFGLNI